MTAPLSETTETIAKQLRETAALHADLPSGEIEQILKAANLMVKALRQGRKLIWLGNGGSATQAQHMAAELVGRFARERAALSSISLTENMASVTAIANDYAFDQVFVRQLEGLAKPGDVAVGLSTSGKSPNVLLALRRAKTMKLGVIGLTGHSGELMRAVCDVCICVPSSFAARIQEVHLTIGHILCGLVEDAFATERSA